MTAEAKRAIYLVMATCAVLHLGAFMLLGSPVFIVSGLGWELVMSVTLWQVRR